MTWTYTPDFTTSRDQIRLKIGDTNTNSQLLSDEEIAQIYDEQNDDILLAVVGCIKSIIAKLARDYDRNNQGFSASRSQQIQHYRDLLLEYQGTGIDGALAAATGFVGGLSKATEDGYYDDDDWKSNQFRIGQDDNETPHLDSSDEN